MKRLKFAQSIVVMFAATVAHASVIDAPHNETNSINCACCHSYSLWWQYSPAKQNASPDHGAIADTVCMSCHNSAVSQPEALTHSSTIMNSTLHETWGVGCTDCHNPHHQDQLSWIGTATDPYLVTGTISEVAYNRALDQSTISYLNATDSPNWPPEGVGESDPDWGNKSLANADRGLILVHDKIKALNTFSIDSATSFQVVVKGEIQANAVDPTYIDPQTRVKNSATCNTFGLIYGQLIKRTIASKNIRFFEPTGGFVEEGAATAGICQVCHAGTTHFANSGLFPSGADSHAGRESGNCTTCHKHKAGFKGDGHDGTSFAWAGDCATCHDADLSVVNITAEIHGRSCGLCHLDPGGGGPRREGDTVNGIDGSALNATNASTCLDCHEAAAYPSGGIHHGPASGVNAMQHLAVIGGTCSNCHGNAIPPLLADGQPLATTTTCASCHRNGAGGPANNSGYAVGWNDPDYRLGCADCHDFPPAYPGSETKANSHEKHPFSCNYCHAATSADGVSITGTGRHANGVIDVVAGPDVFFSYMTGPSGGACSEVSCHGGDAATWGASATFGCLSCHAKDLVSRRNVTGQFAANSHHVQGVALANRHCYQCHWEAGPEGEITSYHQGRPGGSVDLVVYGAGVRPTSYVDNITAVSYQADGSRQELRKINGHCLGCHSDQNNSIEPFSDGKTPRRYSTSGESVAARYSQSGFAPWGKYPAVGAKKNQKKAYSAHGRTDLNEGGGVPPTYINSTGSLEIVLCYDCHNSHGANIAGVTTSYASAAVNGGILKETQAGQGGYSMSYQPAAGGRSSGNNAYNPGAGLCFDCHLSSAGGNKPWGFSTTFGASKPILGADDTAFFGSSDLRVTHNGGHLGSSMPLGHQPTGTINGLCTPCHDPHGVSPALGVNQAYAVPLLKGTWLTSPYLLDGPPLFGGSSSNENAYNVDHNTFGSGRIAEDANLFAGLCLSCHPVSSLDPDTNNQWKSMDRVHDTVKGWGANSKHSFSCSKCHGPHSSQHLPRLLVTNCLDYRHQGKVGYNSNPTLTGNSGGFPSYGYGPCHQSTNSNSWPDNQGWNIVSPWEDRDEDHAVIYPNQTISSQEDCDDNNPLLSRPLDGTCDGDHDGVIDATAGGTDCNDNDITRGATGCDADQDGVLSKAVGGYDCDDSNPAILDAADGNCDNDGDVEIDYTAGGTDCFDADPTRQAVVDGTCDGDNDGLVDSIGGGTDCDDNSAAIKAASDGSCDSDNDGFIDRTAGGPDCDDANAVIGKASDGTCDGDYDYVIDNSAGGQDCDDGNYYISSAPDGFCDGDTDGAIDWQAGGNDCNDGSALVKPPCSLEGDAASYDYNGFKVVPDPGWRGNLFYGRQVTVRVQSIPCTDPPTCTGVLYQTITDYTTYNSSDTVYLDYGIYFPVAGYIMPHYSIYLP